tara:strand:- start:237 stop:1688 length:1452 start_codon:yes stop_codon:yes gene_type:complete
MIIQRFRTAALLTVLCVFTNNFRSAHAQPLVGETLTVVQSASGDYISWREHLIDDPVTAGINFSGSDGFVMGDIDRDGIEDIVSVHESDAEYDSGSFLEDFVPPIAGHVRIHYGSNDPDLWFNITVAEAEDVPAPEDAVLADLNQDGWLDIVVAAERSHLIYLQNPGNGSRSEVWQRLILPLTRDKGSYIRVFAADFNDDGVPELTAPNKGAQTPGPADYARSTPVELHTLHGDPLQGDSWQVHVLGNYSIPQNAEPVDIDNDGDLDIVVGTRGESRLVIFENQGDGTLTFIEQAVGINGAQMSGFNLEYADLSGDGRLDIIGTAPRGLVWIEQPTRKGDAWNANYIGTFAPDSHTGYAVADIDGDGDIDLMAGSYSRGDRTGDDHSVGVDGALGRIGWFENPGAEAVHGEWRRHDISRRKRGMFDKFMARDLDGDGDLDFIGTRGNSYPYDGVFWLEQVRTDQPRAAFQPARDQESGEMPLP